MRNLRALMTRHHCGRCQRVFCLAHTAYSTHGPSGQCGAESACLCYACFAGFTPAYRAALGEQNTLRGRQRTLSGPPGGGPRGSAEGGGRGGELWRRGWVKLVAVSRLQHSVDGQASPE